MKRLFLDDSRNPGTCCNYMHEFGVDSKIYKEDWIVVRNYEQFVNYIVENGLPDIISFDHDLADINYNPKTGKESFAYYERTGMDCAKWLVEYCMDNNKKLPEFIVHSMNTGGGKDNIKGLLEGFKKHQENEIYKH